MEATEDGLPPHDWQEVAQFDHDIENPMGHDVSEEGLHVDVYRDGEKFMTTADFLDVPLSDVPQFCETYLQENAEFLIGRFERWHDVGEKWL
jgi:hypothetical protein